MTAMLSIVALALPLLIPAIWLYALFNAPPADAFASKKLAVLIAHPDDEAMFFSPTLLSLTPSNPNISVLCLSSGDADGLGHVRKKELVESCRLLGVKGSVDVIEHPDLQDSMQHTWPSTRIVEMLEKHARDADVIITFDEGGVSGHPNHISLLHGARAYAQSRPRDVEVWKLRSVGLARKYSFVVDALTTRVLRGKEALMFVSSRENVRRGQKAMTNAHKSQMRWFRWGWIGLSRYMVVNDLIKDEP